MTRNRWTWGDISERFIEAIGKESRGGGRRDDHLSSAHRRVATELDLPEFDHRNLQLPTNPETDWVELPDSVVFIYSVFDSSTDTEIYRDANLRHHGRFRDGDLPPVGALTRYIRAEDRIYLRDRPSESVNILIDYKYLPDNLSGDESEEFPETPAQYDEAILRYAIADYYETAPSADSEELALNQQRAQIANMAGVRVIQGMFDPKTEESKGRHDTMRQRGYNFNIGGR